MSIKKLLTIDYAPNGRIFGLDLLRAIAILSVLLAHGELLVRSNFPDFPNFQIVDGVELFFVLSGYLIGGILIEEFESRGINKAIILNFLKRRWFRTLPTYFLVLVFTLIYNLISYRSFGDYSTRYLLLVQNFFNSHPKFFSVAWSLAIEEWFYLLFPLVAISIHLALPKVNVKAVLGFTISIFLIIPLLYRLKKGLVFAQDDFSVTLWDELIRKTVATRLDTIAFGVLGAYLRFYFPKSFYRFKAAKFIVGLGVIFGLAPFLAKGIIIYTIYFDALAFGLLLLLPLLASIKSAPSIISAPITYLSIISYSVYLVHFNLVLAPMLHFFQPFSHLISVIFFIMYFLLTIGGSVVLYNRFERPITKLREKKFYF